MKEVTCENEYCKFWVENDDCKLSKIHLDTDGQCLDQVEDH